MKIEQVVLVAGPGSRFEYELSGVAVLGGIAGTLLLGMGGLFVWFIVQVIKDRCFGG